MVIREFTENYENEKLSKFAQKSNSSLGRKVYEDECDIRTCFQRDRDRILHSKAFRRLSHKTQVFISPNGDHYRTRLSHTLEVSQIARTISRALNLNEDLTEAIALGHDLGHTPFGHTGEDALSEIIGEKFHHNRQSVRVVELLEKDGKGLNLSRETIDGILTHRGSEKPKTLEAKVVQISDKIAYVNHDIEDSIRAGLLQFSDLPKDIIDVLGDNSSDSINYLILNIVKNSHDKNDIIISPDAKNMLYTLRAYLYENIYNSTLLEKERSKVFHIFTDFFDYFSKNYNAMPTEYVNLINAGYDKQTIVCDFIAGMTDRYATNLYKDIYVPKNWG